MTPAALPIGTNRAVFSISVAAYLHWNSALGKTQKSDIVHGRAGELPLSIRKLEVNTHTIGWVPTGYTGCLYSAMGERDAEEKVSMLNAFNVLLFIRNRNWGYTVYRMVTSLPPPLSAPDVCLSLHDQWLQSTINFL